MRRLVVLAFIWGWSFLFIKVAVEGLTPSTVAWARVTLGATVLNVVLRRSGGRIPTERIFVRHFALAALAASVVPFTLLAWGEQRISSALTAVLNASTPLFTALFAGVAKEERLRPLQVGGLAVGLGGVAVAAGIGTSDLQGSYLAGALAAIGAGACYGVAFVYLRRHLMGIPPLVASAGLLSAAAIILTPVALTTSLLDGVSLTPRRLGAVLLLGVFGTGIAYVLNTRIIAELGPTRASLVTYIIPVVAVAVGVVVLDEPFEWRLVLGGLITIAGIAAVTFGRRPPPGPTTPSTSAGVPLDASLGAETSR